MNFVKYNISRNILDLIYATILFERFLEIYKLIEEYHHCIMISPVNTFIFVGNQIHAKKIINDTLVN